jgi:6-pyruvoyltetrahydropterin/6-carboxytetrahydropterin synthase
MPAIMTVGKEFVFHAAHNLTGYKGKCEKLHGHSYRLRVAVEGPVSDDGMVMDFAEIDRVVRERVIDVLDHSYVNDIVGGSASIERLAEWVWGALKDVLPLRRIEMRETDTNFLVYEGPR